MDKIKLVFSNSIYMLKSVWTFNKLLFWGRLLNSMLNGIIAPLNAYILKILVEILELYYYNIVCMTIFIVKLLTSH